MVISLSNPHHFTQAFMHHIIQRHATATEIKNHYSYYTLAHTYSLTVTTGIQKAQLQGIYNAENCKIILKPIKLDRTLLMHILHLI